MELLDCQSQSRREIPYKLVGGLKKEIDKIRYMIELPFKTSNKKDQQVGILMHGPPGCGKTLIAQEMAKAMGGCYFKVISGPELMNRYVGVAERQLCEIVEECQKESLKRNLPSIIFFDECDAVLSNRDSCDSQFEVRFVNMLLSLLSGFDGRGKLIFIGATNRPHVIDPALRRPGRFDKDILIGTPDCQGREDIIHIFVQKTKEEYEVDLILNEEVKELASLIEGYNGSDIQGLFQEAKDLMLRRCFTIDQFGEFEKKEELFLTYKDLLAATLSYVPHYKRVEDKL